MIRGFIAYCRHFSDGALFVRLVFHSFASGKSPSSVLVPPSHQQYFIHLRRKKYGPHYRHSMLKVLEPLKDHLQIPLRHHTLHCADRVIGNFVFLQSRTDFEHHGSEFTNGQRFHPRISWYNMILWLPRLPYMCRWRCLPHNTNEPPLSKTTAFRTN